MIVRASGLILLPCWANARIYHIFKMPSSAPTMQIHTAHNMLGSTLTWYRVFAKIRVIKNLSCQLGRARHSTLCLNCEIGALDAPISSFCVKNRSYSEQAPTIFYLLGYLPCLHFLNQQSLKAITSRYQFSVSVPQRILPDRRSVTGSSSYQLQNGRNFSRSSSGRFIKSMMRSFGNQLAQ